MRRCRRGHEIGLHYLPSRYRGTGWQKRLNLDLLLLSDIAGQRIASASQHMPISSKEVSFGNLVQSNAYEPRFMAGAMQYVSDSLMRSATLPPTMFLTNLHHFNS